MKNQVMLLALSMLFLGKTGFAQSESSKFTQLKQQQAKEHLPFDNSDDFRDAKQGFIRTIDEPKILNANGTVAYDLTAWNFMDKEAAPTANPSLWRQGQLNKIHGLFEVVPGKIYQVRGFDLANMTFVRTNNGWVVIDVTTAKASAKAGYDLVKKHFGDLPIKAVIFTHPHIDHYAGIDAILEGAPNKDIEIIAPNGFFEHAISEAVTAGTAMARRASYMYGVKLQKNEKGSIGSGLGTVNALGQQSNAVPTTEITKTGEKLTIDSLDIEFIYAEETEAPSEIMTYFPQYKAFCTAEEMNRTLHNLITLRGAKVRNGKNWSKCIDEALRFYGNQVEVSFGTHHWPTWGNSEIVSYWEDQRDMYRYLHDQTLHLANKGYTPIEIAEMVKLPESLDKKFYNRGYYGTVSHDVKAQYQLYYGWFDGNPANLNPLPPTEQGKKFVDAIGGADKVLSIAKTAYDAGEYRWCATLLNNLVFAQPTNKAAREQLAMTYDQLGYQAESGPWRNFYLTGAVELRKGVNKSAVSLDVSAELLDKAAVEELLDLLAVQINGQKAAQKEMVINLTFNKNNKATLILKNGALTNRIDYHAPQATAEINIAKIDFINIMLGKSSLDKLVKEKKAEVKGSISALAELMSVTEASDNHFNIIEP